jgi:hypothetical protein
LKFKLKLKAFQHQISACVESSAGYGVRRWDFEANRRIFDHVGTVRRNANAVVDVGAVEKPLFLGTLYKIIIDSPLVCSRDANQRNRP